MNRIFFEDELSELAAHDLYRKIRTLEKTKGAHAVFEGRDLLLFCGNDYLGLSKDRRVLAAFQEAAADYGVGSGAARLISGTTALHTRLEERIAESKKKESALVYSAGYLANLGVLTALAGEKDLIVMDKLCHASLIDGARLSGATVRVFPHKNYGRLEEILEKNEEHRKRIIVSDTVFSMDGDLADLPGLVRIKEKYDCLLIVDDAHGTGVLGLKGGGAAEDLGLEAKIDVITGTLSKAVGCLGGFAAASKTVIEYLVNFSRPFIFATSLSPALCAAALEAFKIFEEDAPLRHKLWQNIQKINDGILSLGFSSPEITSPIFPIILGDEKKALEASESLLQQGIFVPAIRPPSVPKGSSRLRLTVSAAHSEEDIAKLMSALQSSLLSPSRMM